MDDRVPRLDRDAADQAIVCLVDHDQVSRDRLIPLLLPPSQLSSHVVLALSHGSEADLVDVDPVERSQSVDQVGGERTPVLRAQLQGLIHVVEDEALDLAHDVEGDPDDLRIRASGEHPGHRDGRALQRGEEAPLPAHVVSSGQDLAEGRAAQDDSMPVRPRQTVGQVGPPAGDELGRYRSLESDSVVGQPGDQPAQREGCTSRLRARSGASDHRCESIVEHDVMFSFTIAAGLRLGRAGRQSFGIRWANSGPTEGRTRPMPYDFSPAGIAMLDAVRRFMDDHIYPNEAEYHEQRADVGPNGYPPVMDKLKAAARERGLWNLFLPHLAPDSPGTKLSNVDYAPVSEQLGKVTFASEALNCSAPDTGNMEILNVYASAG